MNDYIELRIDANPCNETITDVLAALLCDEGYESFVPDEKGITAYIKKECFNADALDSIISDSPIPVKTTYRFSTVEGEDWNKEWEKNYFQPIVVGDRCVIHSSFHTGIPEVEYDIVIDPKMAFGTGHHQTTSLIIEQLLDMDLSQRSVMDMGTGTGILAILAAMRGAKRVEAIEIDEFAYTNAVENVAINHHPEINVILGDAAKLQQVEPVDIFIANINRNIITNDLPEYANTLNPDGTMLLSGFYEEDIPVITEAAHAMGLRQTGFTVKDRWTCLRLTKGSH